MSARLDSIVFGGGCFWCLDASYRLVNGVIDVTSGFAGGHTADPTYYEVVDGKTGHAEVVKVEFDLNVISLNDILDIFWAIHNPTTLNKQGYDKGTQYRSIILWNNIEQEKVIAASIEAVTELWEDPIVTEVATLGNFYTADEDHQNYFQKHPDMAYCQVIINPKLAKLRKKFSAQIKNNKI